MIRSSLSIQIIAGFATSFLALVLVTFLTIRDASDVVESNTELTAIKNNIMDLQEVLRFTIDVESGQRGYLLTSKEEYLEPFIKAKSELSGLLSNLEKRINDPNSLTSIQMLEDLVNQRVQFADRVVDREKAKKHSEAVKLIQEGEGKDLQDEVRNVIDTIINHQRSIFDAKLREAESNLTETIRTASIGLGFTILLLFVGSFYLIRSISAPITQLVQATEKLGAGELTFRIKVRGHNELEQLSTALNGMGEKLAQLVEKEKKLNRLLENMSFASVFIGSEAIESSTDINDVLQTITDQSCLLAGADYAALGLGTDPEKEFSPWVFSGMKGEVKDDIGRFPRAVGLLGWVARQGQVMRLSDLRENPIFRGFPDKHPDMQAFLGVPIRFQGRAIGNLYLARKPGKESFTEYDQKAVELLTANAGVVLENSRLQRELMKAISAREDILAIVSHDLKNPVSAIRLSSDLLSRKAPVGEDGDAIRRHSGDIRTSANQMLRMIGDLLDAASVEAGRIQVNLKVQAARSLLENLDSQFRSLAEEREINLAIETPDEDFSLYCDADRIYQVFSNLIGNALKFTPPNGTVRLSHHLLPGAVKFSVSDTGAGIRSEDLEHLFDRYWQVKGTKQKGTGLGLYIAKGIVEAHDGTMEVSSQLHKGTTFSFTLKLADSQQVRAQLS